jgi:hypothetical protein
LYVLKKIKICNSNIVYFNTIFVGLLRTQSYKKRASDKFLCKLEADYIRKNENNSDKIEKDNLIECRDVRRGDWRDQFTPLQIEITEGAYRLNNLHKPGITFFL